MKGRREGQTGNFACPLFLSPIAAMPPPTTLSLFLHSSSAAASSSWRPVRPLLRVTTTHAGVSHRPLAPGDAHLAAGDPPHAWLGQNRPRAGRKSGEEPVERR